jgi:Domain of unknown function (DUF4350)
MKDWSKLLRRYWILGLVLLLILILTTVLSGSGESVYLQGSTYSTQPSGYGAWYQMMIDRGVAIERWRKTPEQMASIYPNNTTFIQINSELRGFNLPPNQQQWIEQGNTMIVLGVDAPVHDTEFTKDFDTTAYGKIRIDGTRRFTYDPDKKSSYFLLSQRPQDLLADSQGAVVWQSDLGKGKLFLVTTPHLAANAYQDFPANYALLQSLTSQDRKKIVVDEYLHGYRDTDSTVKKAKSIEKSWESYMMGTPLAILFVNLCLVIGLFTWQQNRRFGNIVTPQPPQIDNSVAYIEALGGVLRQAQTSEFVLKNIGKAEQLKLQQQLGLGNKLLVDHTTLIDAWIQQTQLPNPHLPGILQLATGQKRLPEAELQQWLAKLQALSDQLKQQPR